MEIEIEVHTYSELAASLVDVDKTDDGENLIIADVESPSVYPSLCDAIGAEPSSTELAEFTAAYNARVAQICDAAIS